MNRRALGGGDRRESLVIGAGTVLTVLVVSTLGTPVAGAMVPSWLYAGVAIPLGVCFGLPVVAGVTVGVVLRAAWAGYLGPLAAVQTGSLAAMAFLASRYWSHRLLPAGPAPAGTRRWVGQYLGVVGAVSVAGAALTGWGYELFGLGPFFVSAPSALATNVASTLLVSGVLLPVVSRSDTLSNACVDLRDVSPSRTRRALLVALPLLWVGGGVVGSVGFRLGRRLFAGAEATVIRVLLDPTLFGHGGRRAQVVFGAVLLAGIVLATTEPEPR